MKQSIIIVLAVTFLVLVSCNNVTVPGLHPGSPESAGVSAGRLARIDSGWIAGAVGFISRNGKIIYHKAFGVSDIENNTPMRTDNIFRIASQTKAIVSVGMMMLYEEGKFLLDDPVSKYIPEFKNPAVLDKFSERDTSYTTLPARREITIRDLFTHTSGIDYAGIGSDVMRKIYTKGGIRGGFGGDEVTIGDDMVRLGKMPLVHHPGEKFTYGLNVDVIGYLIEILSGEKLDIWLKKRLFGPLGMNDTWFYLPPDRHGRLVKVSTENREGKAVSMPQNLADYPLLAGGKYFSGGAGLSSTTGDYAIFLQMLLNRGVYNGKRLLARRTVELITSNQIGDLSIGRNKFGLGFEIMTEEGQAQLGITEGSFSWGGYYGTIYWADPKERLVGQLYMQQVPISHSDIENKFKAMVYQALDD
jgi:CubicO group peptidase (beta-lactamase class C family)